MRTKKLRVIGFGPFQEFAINPSQVVVQQLETLQLDQMNLCCQVLPVTYSAAQSFGNSINWNETQAVLMLGLNPKISHVALEKRALNRQDSRHADSAGITRNGMAIDGRAPGHLDTPLNLHSMVTRMSTPELPVEVSLYAGEYVCNSLYFSCLNSGLKTGIPILFVHIPRLTDRFTLDKLMKLIIKLMKDLSNPCDSDSKTQLSLTTQSEVENFLYNYINYEQKTDVGYNAENYSLSRFHAFLSSLGNPEKSFRSVHVAGTKGKGATCAVTASILSAHGYRTGFFSSPHLVDIRERIRMDGHAISCEDFSEVASKIHDAVQNEALPSGYRTTFELLTATAFCYFQQMHPDWVVLETGMGGRLDCTNVVTPEVSAVTRLDYDHVDSLGDTLRSIATEKAGIGKLNVPMVIGRQAQGVSSLIELPARQHGALLHRSDSRVRITDIRQHSSGLVFTAQMSQHYLADISTQFQGMYQVENCQTALAILDLLETRNLIQLDEEAIRKGFQAVRWPGRFTVLEDACLPELKLKCPVVVDGAHNPAAMKAAGIALNHRFPGRKITTILSVPANKDHIGILESVAAFSQGLICTQYKNVRALDPEKLKDLALGYTDKVQTASDLQASLRIVSECFPETDVLLISGSLYLAGEALRNAGMEALCLNIY